MHFLADVTVTCEACDGRRFSPRVLGVRYQGKSVEQILALTVDQALEFFADRPKLVARLRPLAEVGLGYLRLSQPTSTLSGGEVQRLKLAAYLSAPAAAGRGKLFILDEPTTGLHLADVAVLMTAFARVLAAGHTLVVVEHHLDVIRQADHIIDLGPEGGEAGGEVLVAGSVAEVMACPRSHTGQILAALAGSGQGAAAAEAASGGPAVPSPEPAVLHRARAGVR